MTEKQAEELAEHILKTLPPAVKGLRCNSYRLANGEYVVILLGLTYFLWGPADWQAFQPRADDARQHAILHTKREVSKSA